MKSKIIKLGNSAGIIIPAHILEESGLHRDDTVDVIVKNAHIVIEQANPVYLLDELLKQTPPENIKLDDLDREWLSSHSVGREIILYQIHH